MGSNYNGPRTRVVLFWRLPGHPFLNVFKLKQFLEVGRPCIPVILCKSCELHAALGIFLAWRSLSLFLWWIRLRVVTTAPYPVVISVTGRRLIWAGSGCPLAWVKLAQLLHELLSVLLSHLLGSRWGNDRGRDGLRSAHCTVVKFFSFLHHLKQALCRLLWVGNACHHSQKLVLLGWLVWVEELLNFLTCRRILNGLWSSTCLSSDARCPSKYLLLLQRLLELLLLLLRPPLAVSRSSRIKNTRIEAVDSAERGLIQTRLHHRLSLHGQIQSLHCTARICSCYMGLRVFGRLMAVTQEKAAFSSDWALGQVIYVDGGRLLLPDISDRSSRRCTLVSRASIVLPCLVIPELLLFCGVALWALIQIV